MANEIKPGDVVKLKSGSLPMTVAWIEDDQALCEWFDSKNEPREQSYALTVLELVY